MSQRIANADGSSGANYSRAVQFQEQNLRGTYSVDPTRIAPYAQLPQPTLIGSFNSATLQPFGTGDPVHRLFQMWQQTGGANRDLHGRH